MKRITMSLSLAAALLALGCSKNNEPEKEAPAAEKTAEPTVGGPEHGKPETTPPHAATGSAMGAPHGGMPATGGMPGQGASAVEVAEDGTADFGAFTMKAPKTWTYSAPSSSMRAAQWAVPGDAGDAELVVYYFGEGGAGGVDANLQRWYGQFQQEGGKSTAEVAKTDKKEIAGMPVTTVFVTGRYVAAMQPGAAAKHDSPDYAMLGAIVESAKGPYYFKMVGPEETVKAAQGDFDAFVQSLTAAEGGAAE